MKIETADEAIEAFMSLGEWQYADREAAWKWMFEQGQLAEREACAVTAWMTGINEHNKSIGMPCDAREIGSACARNIRMRGK